MGGTQKFVHIGFPKNFSTTLQRSLFSKHKDLYYLGIGYGDNISYRDDILNSCFEVYLKFTKEFKYQAICQRLKDNFEEHLRLAEAEGKKWIGASSEHLSFSFTYDVIDFPTKMKRLSELWGSDTQIILILRNQMDLVISMYREFVRVGYAGTYAQYIYELYKFQDRNFLFDLRYDLIYKTLSLHFPGKINILFFEDFKENGGQLYVDNQGEIKLLKRLGEILEVSTKEISLGHFNEALSDAEVLVKRELNQQVHHDLGNPLTSSAEIHRQAKYFGTELNLYEPEDVSFADVLKKRDLIALAKARSVGMEDKRIKYSADKDILKILNRFFREGNEHLAKMTELTIPTVYFESH